jgi:hypothetical protein
VPCRNNGSLLFCFRIHTLDVSIKIALTSSVVVDQQQTAAPLVERDLRALIARLRQVLILFSHRSRQTESNYM